MHPVVKFNFRNELEKAFDNWFGARSMPDWFNNQSIPVKMWETADKLYIEADVPGVKTEDLDVVASNGTIKISINRKEEKEQKQGTFYYKETAQGEYERTLSLPDNVNEEAISAELKNGVLRLTLEKVDATPRKKIEIKTKS